MANYIPWYGKKRERLIERDRAFVALLQGETDPAKLAGAAEAVRAEQVRALRSKRAQLPPSEKNAAAVANLDREIAFWLALTAEAIIDGYRAGNLSGHRSRAAKHAAR